MPRVDLKPLAARLSEEEPGATRWAFDGIGHITPRLHLEGAAESALEPQRFREALVSFLEAAK